MARFINIVWLLLLVVQSLYQGLVYAYYVSNKAYIIEQLCENKAQPELKCDGKCHLRKVLQVEPAPESSEPTPYLPSWEELKLPILFCQVPSSDPSFLTFTTSYWVVNEALFDYRFDYRYEPSSHHWQPPRAA